MDLVRLSEFVIAMVVMSTYLARLAGGTARAGPNSLALPTLELRRSDRNS